MEVASNLTRAILLATSALLFGCAPVSTVAAVKSITVSKTPWGGLCAGICPFYTVTVTSDGEVIAQNHLPVRLTRLRVTPDEAERFFSLIAPYRPPISTEGEPVCPHNVRPEDVGFVQKVREIEIVWSEPSRQVRLVACDGALIDEALGQALWSVHLFVTADPRPN